MTEAAERARLCQRCGRRGAESEDLYWRDTSGDEHDQTVWLCWDCGVVFEAMCDAWHFGKELYSSRIQPGGYSSINGERIAATLWLLEEIRERRQRRKGRAGKEGHGTDERDA